MLDYHVLSEGTNEEGETVRRVLLVVAYRELVDRYVDACRRAGIRLVGIDLEAFALLRALAPPREEGYGSAGSALVAVSIGHDRTTFAVSDGRACEFTRVLEWGGYSLNVAVARALDVTPSEAEPVKRSLSLHGSRDVEGLSPEQAEAAREAMRKQVQTFARELVSSLQFYQDQAGSLAIGRDHAHGRHGAPRRARRGARAADRRPRRRRRPARPRRARQEGRGRGAARLASRSRSAWGSRASPMRAVNLLPKDSGRARAAKKRETPKHLPLIVGGVLGALVLGFLGMQTMSASGAISDNEAALQDLNAQIAATPPPPRRPACGRRRARQPADASAPPPSPRRSRVASRGTGCSGGSRSSSRTTSGSRRSTLSTPTPATSPAGTPPTTGTGFTMNGFTYSHDAVARLLSRLAVVPDLANVQLLSSTRTKLKGRDVVSFSITAGVRSGSTPA